MKAQNLFWAPLRILEQDHDLATARLGRYASAIRSCGVSSTGRVQLAQQIARLVGFLEARTAPHFKTEEDIVFPHLLRLMPVLRKDLRRLFREHQAFRRDLSRLQRAMAGPSFDAAKLNRLSNQALSVIANLRSHILREQTLMERFDPKELKVAGA